jgi:hypothetical protein
MPTDAWHDLSATEKADALRREFDGFREQEKENLQVRHEARAALERRMDALEEALKQMAARLDKIERKNEQSP